MALLLKNEHPTEPLSLFIEMSFIEGGRLNLSGFTGITATIYLCCEKEKTPVAKRLDGRCNERGTNGLQPEQTSIASRLRVEQDW
jgi:hypothetical protein